MQITKNILSYIMLLFNVQLHPRTRSGSVGKLVKKGDVYTLYIIIIIIVYYTKFKYLAKSVSLR